MLRRYQKYLSCVQLRQPDMTDKMVRLNGSVGAAEADSSAYQQRIEAIANINKQKQSQSQLEYLMIKVRGLEERIAKLEGSK